MTPRHFAWQAWYNSTSTVVSRGRRGTNSHSPSCCVAGVALMVPGGALGPGFGACDAAALCVAGVVQLDIHLRFTWQAWYNLTSTFVSRGRRGTNSHPPSFCVAGVAFMVPGGALGPGFGACDAAALCVAGVAQLDIHLHFTWQAWHELTFTVVLRGRRGTNSHPQQLVSEVTWVSCMQRGGPSGMFRLSVCFGMFAFGLLGMI